MKKKKRPNFILKRSPWLILSVLIILILAFLVGIKNPFNTTGQAIQSISFIKAGNEMLVQVSDIDGLKLVNFHFLEDTKGAIIKFEAVENLTHSFEGTIYSQFQITSEVADNLGDLDITLKIKEEELIELGLANQDSKLYLDGEELETTQTKIEGNYVYYEAIAPNLGEFVIGKAKPKPKPEPEPVEETIVGKVPETPEPIEEEPEIEETPPVIEQPTPVEEGFFSKIINFFKNLFS